INLKAARRRMYFVRHPEQAVFNRAAFDARGRASASGAALGADGKLFRFLLARGRDPFGFGFKLELVGNHADGPGGTGLDRHRGDYTAAPAGPGGTVTIARQVSLARNGLP